MAWNFPTPARMADYLAHKVTGTESGAVAENEDTGGFEALLGEIESLSLQLTGCASLPGHWAWEAESVTAELQMPRLAKFVALNVPNRILEVWAASPVIHGYVACQGRS